MPRLRILMVAAQLGYGGAERSFLRLAKYLAIEADVTIGLMGRNYGEGSYSTFHAETDLPVVMLDENNATPFSRIGKVGRWWRMLVRLRALKREHHVAISFLSGPNLLNALAGLPHKTIVSERGSKRHDNGMTRLQRTLWTRILDPLTYWRASWVVAASEGLAHEIVTANRWTAERVVAIEGTVKSARLVDAADFDVEPEIAALADFETVVTYGRLHKIKGYDFLLRVFAQLRVIRPRARLLLIGDGPEEERLREIARELGLTCAEPGKEADVIFTGVRSQPIRYARLGRVFVLPSRSEGLPNSLIEALAAGVQVLAADCPWGPRSILSEGELTYWEADPILPAKLRHGKLMPVPEATGALQCWVTELDWILAAPPTRSVRDERLRVTARYDIATTGPIWLRLAQQLSRSALRSHN